MTDREKDQYLVGEVLKRVASRTGWDQRDAEEAVRAFARIVGPPQLDHAFREYVPTQEDEDGWFV